MLHLDKGYYISTCFYLVHHACEQKFTLVDDYEYLWQILSLDSQAVNKWSPTVDSQGKTGTKQLDFSS